MTVMLIGSNRIWTIRYGAGPDNIPVFQHYGMLGAIDWGQGDVTDIEVPSDTQYNAWDSVGDFQASADRVTSTITVYETNARSSMLELAIQRCAVDVQVHKGICQDPRDFNSFEKVRVIEEGKISSFATSDNGALEGDGQEKMTEDLAISGARMYEVLRMAYTEAASTQVGEEVIAIAICDRVVCGGCEGEDASDGCNIVMAITNSAGSSPGLLPQVVATKDKFSNIVERWITTFTIGDNASDGECVGTNLVVVSSDGEALHYADKTNILNSAETWSKVTTGIVAAKGPTHIYNYSPLISYISGLGGYVYKMVNVGDGVTVLDAGVATSDNLNEINGWGSDRIAAVGANNAFVYSTDGATFAAGTVTDLATTDLNTVAYRTAREVWVAGDNNILYYTTNYGTNWGSKALPASVTQVDKIIWATKSVGYVLARTTTPVARVYRTINGGYSWYLAPEDTSLTVPTADGFNDIVACEANRVYIGGLADDASDGILVKGTD
jgi:photosystem II stability/assembly factor-like uncharacterized protein